MLTTSLAELLRARLAKRGITVQAADAYDLAEFVEDVFELEEPTQRIPKSHLEDLMAASKAAS